MQIICAVSLSLERYANESFHRNIKPPIECPHCNIRGTLAALGAVSAAAYPRLVGDVGGTHARFARIEQAGEDIASVATFAAGDYSGLDAVISRYLEAQGRPPPARHRDG